MAMVDLPAPERPVNQTVQPLNPPKRKVLSLRLGLSSNKKSIFHDENYSQTKEWPKFHYITKRVVRIFGSTESTLDSKCQLFDALYVTLLTKNAFVCFR